MKTRRRTAAIAAALLVSGVLVITASPAQANHVSCGAVITQSTTLDSDVGPCPGDGLVVAAGNVTLDLGGHRVFAANGAGDNAGIRLANVSGVTVRNGTVQGFDAGVAVFGGGNNRLQALTVQDNINDFGGFPCDLGDGIALFNSDGNRVEGNRILHNGPFGGITTVEDSDSNVIRGNTVRDNNVVSPPGAGCGNSRQDEGIRIEGPGANNNMVEGNAVDRSLLAGIGLHGYVCSDEFGDEIEPPNTNTTVRGNRVRASAGSTQVASGIAILQQGPADIVCPSFTNTIVGNVASQNEEDGIFVAASSMDNTISQNAADSNGDTGIQLNGPRLNQEGEEVAPGASNNTLLNNRGRGNGAFDGADLNLDPPCDDNTWRGNRFGTVNQPCVAAGGTGSAPPAPTGLRAFGVPASVDEVSDLSPRS